MFTKKNIIIANVVLIALFALTCYSTVLTFSPKSEIKKVSAVTTQETEVVEVVERLARAEYDVITIEPNMFDALLQPPPKTVMEAPPPDLKWKLKGTVRYGNKKIAYIDMPLTKTTTSGRRRGPKKKMVREVKEVKEGDRLLGDEVVILEINIEEQYVKYQRT